MPAAKISHEVYLRLRRVPAFPPVAARLLTTLSSEDVDIGEVARMIASDPVLSARVLQFSNSAEFALLEPITDLRHALAILGLERTRKSTLSIALAAYSGAGLKAAELRRCWEHTVATAVVAEHIGGPCGFPRGTCYTAGILHDLGRMGLIAAYPHDYERTIIDAGARCIDLLDYETEVFGLDHTAAGRWLAHRWDLPEMFRVVAGRHHDPCEGHETTLLRVVHIACRVSDALGYWVTRPLQPPDLTRIAAELPPAAGQFLVAGSETLFHQIRAAITSFDGAEHAPVDVQRYTEEPTEVEPPEEPPAPPPAPESWLGQLIALLRRLL